MPYVETASYVGSVQWTAVTSWAASTAYTVGQLRKQLAAPAAGSERVFVCRVAGTSGGTEPTWVTTRGATTADNTASWAEVTGRPALNADVTNTPPWAASQGAVVVGHIIKNIAATHYFMVTTAGTGGTGAEPTWNTTTGATTADASATYTCLGAVGSFTTKFGAPAARLGLQLTTSGLWAPNGNMNVYVADDHAEASTAANSWTTPTAPGINVFCVDRTAALPPNAAALRTTASITASSTGDVRIGTAVGHSIYIYGLKLIHTGSGAAGILLGSTSGSRVLLEQCTFNPTAAATASRINIAPGGASTGCYLELRNCTFDLGLNSHTIANNYGTVRMEGCVFTGVRSEEHTSELQSLRHLVCRLLLEKKKIRK